MSKETTTSFLFLLPLIIILTIIICFPLIGTVWTSFWQDVSFIGRRFIGFMNYARLFGDPHFWQSALFTISFPIVSVSLEICLGMICALILNEKFPFRGVVRGVVLLPWAIPSIIGARVWQLLYNYDYGLANVILQKLGLQPVHWLGSTCGAFCSLVVADVWRTTPFAAIILLAGLQLVPDILHEQAKIDGASIYKRFVHITLPTIKPIIIVALLFRTIDALRIFDIIYVITNGGPGGATTSLSLYGYKYFLLGDFGYGSAVSVVLFIIALILALIFVKLGRFRESLA